MEAYECEKCGAPASIVHGAVTRSCACKGAVIANMKATAYGEGRVTVGPSQVSQLIEAIRAIGRAVMSRGL